MTLIPTQPVLDRRYIELSESPENAHHVPPDSLAVQRVAFELAFSARHELGAGAPE